MAALPTRRRRSPRGEGPLLREHLIAAATELIDELGDASRVSVRAITTRAGVSPTALYLHFEDRDALVDAAVDAGFEAFNRTVMSAAGRDAPPTARLEAMGVAYLDFAERQPALYAVIFSARRPMLRTSPKEDVTREEALSGLIAVLRACVPSLDAVQADELAVTIWASLHGFATLRAARSHREWPSAETFVRAVMRAHIAAPAPT